MIFKEDVSLGSTTSLLITSYANVSPKTSNKNRSPLFNFGKFVNNSRSGNPRCAEMTACVPGPPTGKDVPLMTVAPTSNKFGVVVSKSGISIANLGIFTCPITCLSYCSFERRPPALSSKGSVVK